MKRRPERPPAYCRGRNAGVARVITAEGEHVGMGIVLGPRSVLTCAHVVNAALGREDLYEAAPAPPDFRVSLWFPMVANPTVVTARVKGWSPPGNLPGNDVALLVLETDAPAQAGTAVLADVSAMSIEDDPLSVFGFAPGHGIGNHVEAKVMGSAGSAWTQIDGVRATGVFIVPGYSGGAVWDEAHDAVVGMVVSRYVADAGGAQIAYMISTAALVDALQGLPHEERNLAPSFAMNWTLFSSFIFLMLFSHWISNRDDTPPLFTLLSLGGAHKQLSAFWGMHFGAFLLPPLFLMMNAFATSFRLHPWWQRVPGFGRFQAPAASASSRLTAILSLLAFVLLPLAAQFHFLIAFHKEGQVYIYPKPFGYDGTELVRAGESCDERLCTLSKIGRYTVADPRPGAPGGFWDNKYQYGQRDKCRGSVTFYPILQPVVILTLTGLSLILGAIALVRVFRTKQAK